MFLPAGSQDETGKQLANRSLAYEKFSEVAAKRSFKQISTPVVEYAGTFTNPHAGMNLQNMLKWFNRQGEIEVLRPDWTTAIARALANQNPGQLKWFYQGSIFRSDKAGTESRQAGIEIIQTSVFLGESESLLTAITYLNELGLDNYVIELGHTGIFEQLTKDLDLNQEELEKLRIAMHDKRRDEVHQLASSAGSSEVAEELTRLVDAYGRLEVLDSFLDHWTDEAGLTGILHHLKKLARLLEEAGAEVLVDLGRVKNLPYYCGTMFRGFLKENGETCFSGGRYDRLYDQFDRKMSAVGLAFDVDVLADQLPHGPERETLCILASEETHTYAEQLRHSYPDYVTDIRYDLPESQTAFDRIIKIETDEQSYKVVEI